MERAAQGAAQGAVQAPPYELQRARERGCIEVPLNGIASGEFDDNGECIIAIADIHKSTPVAIIFSRTIILANILTSPDRVSAAESMESIEERNRANATRFMEHLKVGTNRIMEELNRIERHVDNRLRSHNPYALVVYPRGEAPFDYNNKRITPAAKPHILRIILTSLDEEMGLKDHVAFGSFDVYPDPPPRHLVYTPLSQIYREFTLPSQLYQGVLHVRGPKLVSPAKGTLVISRRGDRTISHLEHRAIRDHPA